MAIKSHFPRGAFVLLETLILYVLFIKGIGNNIGERIKAQLRDV